MPRAQPVAFGDELRHLDPVGRVVDRQAGDARTPRRREVRPTVGDECGALELVGLERDHGRRAAQSSRTGVGRWSAIGDLYDMGERRLMDPPARAGPRVMFDAVGERDADRADTLDEVGGR